MTPWSHSDFTYKGQRAFKGTVLRDFLTLVFFIFLFHLTSLFMDKKGFVNFCDFASVKALLCHSPLSWTALSEFFSLSKPLKFFHKNYCPWSKEYAYKILSFKIQKCERYLLLTENSVTQITQSCPGQRPVSLRAVPDSGQFHSELSRTAARITQSCPGQRPVSLSAARDSCE